MLKCMYLTFGGIKCTFRVPLSSNSSVCRAVLDDRERDLLNSVDGAAGARLTCPLTDSLACSCTLLFVPSFSLLVVPIKHRRSCASACARVVTPDLGRSRREGNSAASSSISRALIRADMEGAVESRCCFLSGSNRRRKLRWSRFADRFCCLDNVTNSTLMATAT